MKKYAHLTIGVLALQGAVEEHLQQIESLGATAVPIKKTAQLAELDGLVLPGGESTAIGKLMRNADFIPAIQHFARQNKAIFGTCAGMILLAKHIEGDEPSHLDLMDIRVQRNAFGRQVDSFQVDLPIAGLSDPFPAIFIRAPYITQINTDRVEPQETFLRSPFSSHTYADKIESLATFNGNVVLAKQGKLLACSFHPELTQDNRVMQMFLEIAAS